MIGWRERAQWSIEVGKVEVAATSGMRYKMVHSRACRVVHDNTGLCTAVSRAVVADACWGLDEVTRRHEAEVRLGPSPSIDQIWTTTCWRAVEPASGVSRLYQQCSWRSRRLVSSVRRESVQGALDAT